MRKPAPIKPSKPRASDSKLRLDRFAIDPEKHAEFKEAMLAAARAAVDEFPVRLETVKGELRQASAILTIIAFAAYGLRATMDRLGNQTPASPDILQHHGELLQALLLTLPVEEWGEGALVADAVDRLLKSVPKLAETFMMQRILDGEAVEGDQDALVILSLQERIRLHTHGVRNWGYYDQVVALSRDLYGAVDVAMATQHGFSATDMIDTLAAIVSEYERRLEAHWQTLAKVLKGRTPQKLVELYYRHVPGLKDTAKDLLAELPKGFTRDNMLAMIMAHYDLRLIDVASFSVAEVAKLTGRDEPTTAAILRAVSLEPSALAETAPEYLFLDNPVWDRPGIVLGERFVFPMPQMAFSHIHRLMDRLVGEAALQKPLADRRATFLEEQLEAAFRHAFPDAEIRAAVKWRQGEQEFENDLVVAIDRVLILAEAKSHRLTPAGLRGGAERVKRHIKDMVLEPSIQSARLEALIASARGGDAGAAAILKAAKIDFARADRVIRVSVTLDDLSVLTTAEADFKRVGWVPQDHQLAPSILIADLRCLIDILANPVQILHYLSERPYLQKSLNLLGDELDFLGLYLATGFNLAALHDEFTEFSPTGMSAPIDRYYEGRAVGLNVAKPKMELRPLWRDIVERLVQLKLPGWTLLGIHLLSSADPAEQKAVERNLNKLRVHVRKSYRDPQHVSSLVIQPPEKRKAPVMFYLFPEQLRDQQKETMRQLAAETLDAEQRSTCIVFSRSTERWGQAFDTGLLMERKAK